MTGSKTLVQGLIIFSMLVFCGAGRAVYGQDVTTSKVLQSERMKAIVTPEGLASVTDPLDRYGADIVSRRAPWGRLKIVYRTGNGSWVEMPYNRNSRLAENGNRMVLESGEATDPVTLTQSFSLAGNGLDWEIELATRDGKEVEIGDLAIYLPWSIARSEILTRFLRGVSRSITSSPVMGHSSISPVPRVNRRT